jgi:hypothetical protein
MTMSETLRKTIARLDDITMNDEVRADITRARAFVDKWEHTLNMLDTMQPSDLGADIAKVSDELKRFREGR